MLSFYLFPAILWHTKFSISLSAVVKLSDAELHQAVRSEAAKHGATFLRPASTYKYGVFRLADGRDVEMHLYHVRDGKWPADIESFLARQSSSRGRNSDKMLARLKELADSADAELQGEGWEGPHHWYAFLLQDGRTVRIRGSKLMTSGWPKDIDTYLRWSDDRRQGGAQPKSPAALFDEFREVVMANNAVVLATGWKGARVPHDVLLSDGTVRKLKPNQLKYFGWPAVPLDELRKLAAPYPVHLLPDTDPANEQVFRIVLAGGIFLEGTYAELKASWGEGAHEVVKTAACWASSNGLVLQPGRWKGILADYTFIDERGIKVRRQLPDAQVHEARRLNNEGLAKLRRVGAMHQVRLVSTEFRGRDAKYEWTRDDGETFRASMGSLIERSRDAAKLEQLRTRVAALGLNLVLLDTTWQGMCALYRWRTPEGTELTAKLSQLRRSAADKNSCDCLQLSRSAEARLMSTGAPDKLLGVLKCWADSVGLALLSTRWVNVDAAYRWALPDGTHVTASLKKMRNCTRAILRGRESTEPGGSKVLVADCDALRNRVARSKSR